MQESLKNYAALEKGTSMPALVFYNCERKPMANRRSVSIRVGGFCACFRSMSSQVYDR